MDLVYNMIKNRFKELGIDSKLAERVINYTADIVDDGKRNRSAPKIELEEVKEPELKETVKESSKKKKTKKR